MSIPENVERDSTLVLTVVLAFLNLLGCAQRNEKDNASKERRAVVRSLDQKGTVASRTDALGVSSDRGGTQPEEARLRSDGSKAETAEATGSTCHEFPVTKGCAHPKVNESCDRGWCRIPAGCYVYGSPSCQPCGGTSHAKQVQVALTRPFVIRQNEVTQAE